jgi:hypothetical protein
MLGELNMRKPLGVAYIPTIHVCSLKMRFEDDAQVAWPV